MGSFSFPCTFSCTWRGTIFSCTCEAARPTYNCQKRRFFYFLCVFYNFFEYILWLHHFLKNVHHFFENCAAWMLKQPNPPHLLSFLEQQTTSWAGTTYFGATNHFLNRSNEPDHLNTNNTTPPLSRSNGPDPLGPTRPYTTMDIALTISQPISPFHQLLILLRINALFDYDCGFDQLSPPSHQLTDQLWKILRDAFDEIFES